MQLLSTICFAFIFASFHFSFLDVEAVPLVGAGTGQDDSEEAIPLGQASFLLGTKHTETKSAGNLPLRGSHYAAAAAKRHRRLCAQDNILNGTGDISGNTLECGGGGEQETWVTALEVLGGIVAACITAGYCIVKRRRETEEAHA